MPHKDALFTSARTEEEDTRDRWETPFWLYNVLDKEFRFDLDPAATEDNAMATMYMDKEFDGLKQKWFGSVFVNPPYSQLKKWVQKGYDEARNNPSVQNVVMLVPARTDTQAWWNFIRFGEVRFLPGRLRFRLSAADKEAVALKNIMRVAAGKPPLDPENTSAPFPSAIVVFDRDFPAKTVYWSIRESTHASSI